MPLVSNDAIDVQYENYHLYPTEGLLNDPNGLVYFKGKYHVFVQWNPKACNHTYKEWGHFISEDLKTWERLDSALKPSMYEDQSGIYSGGGYVKDDKLYVFYTGNRRDDKGASVASTQMWAVSEDGIHFEKLGVLFPHPEGFTKDVRDPMVWQGKNGHYYLVLGAQTQDKVGDILVYESVDFETWTLRGSLIENELNDVRGYMLECPSVIEVDGRHVLMFSPQGLEPDYENHRYQNVHNTGYVLGVFDEETARFKPETPFIEMDKGFEFYAPQALQMDDGRTIVWGWAGMMTPEQERSVPTIESAGWVHVLTVPRELYVIDDVLVQEPIPEIMALQEIDIFDETLPVGQYHVANTENWQLKFGTTLTLTKSGNRLTMLRDGADDIRVVEGDVDVLDIIVDVDIVEVFTDNHTQTMTARYFK